MSVGILPKGKYQVAVEGTAYWTRARTPKPGEVFMGKPKPPAFYTEIVLDDPPKILVNGQTISLSDYAKSGFPISQSLKYHDNKPFIKFQSKVLEDEHLQERAPGTKGRKPIVTGNIDDDALIGNGSRVRVKGYVNTETKEPGSKVALPTFDLMQVLSLVEYEASSDKTNMSDEDAFAGFEDSPSNSFADEFAAMEKMPEAAPKASSAKKRTFR